MKSWSRKWLLLPLSSSGPATYEMRGPCWGREGPPKGSKPQNSESKCHDMKRRVNSSFIVTLGVTFVHASCQYHLAWHFDAFWYPCIASPRAFGPRFQSHLRVHCFKQFSGVASPWSDCYGLLVSFWVASVFALEGECQNCEVEQVTLLQSKQSTRGQSIIVKGPSPSGGTAIAKFGTHVCRGIQRSICKMPRRHK